jgi:hypothetical protein
MRILRTFATTHSQSIKELLHVRFAQYNACIHLKENLPARINFSKWAHEFHFIATGFYGTDLDVTSLGIHWFFVWHIRLFEGFFQRHLVV